MYKNEIVKCGFKQSFFDPSLDYALKSWTSTFNRMGKPNPYSRAEKIMIGLIAEFAIENYLKENNIKYDSTGKTKWYEEDRYDLGIGEYAIDVKGSFINLNSKYHSTIFNNMFFDELEWYKSCHALVPLDQFNPGKNKNRKHKKQKKIYIFPFVKGNFDKNNINGTLVHTFWDYKWLKRAEYKNFPPSGKLKIIYDGTLEVSSFTIFGTTKKKEMCIEHVFLDKKELTTRNKFFQVFSILWDGEIPDGNLKIHSTVTKLSEIIKPHCKFELTKNENSKGYTPLDNDWQNLQIYNTEIVLLGWIDETKLRIIGKKYPRFYKEINQYSEIKVDNWGCLISELNSMSSLKNILELK